MKVPIDIVGEAEIADRLRVKRPTVHQWAKRNLLPPPEGTVSGQPAWRWSVIEVWAEDRFGLRRTILDHLAKTEGSSTEGLAASLVMMGRRDVSVTQVARDLNAMFQLGWVARAAPPHDWIVTPSGHRALESGELPMLRSDVDAATTFWSEPLVQGGPFPIGVRIRVRRVDGLRRAEIKSPNGEPDRQPEGVLINSYHPPAGFESWNDWFDSTDPSRAGSR